MPQLLKLRFVSLGHPQARMNDLVLDFRGPDGNPVDSTLWLRNGGGKSSILNLFFAIVRPHKGEFLGGKAEARQRSLDDYVLPGDHAIATAEWLLDPSPESLLPDQDRFLTGVFYERRHGTGELRRLFFSCRVAENHPESTIAGLPIFRDTGNMRVRLTLAAFREAWRSLRDRAPHLSVSETENQRDWQDILEAARIDPELFSYQVRMNQREGGADELFRFSEPEDFVDFLLTLALDPSLADRVGRNIIDFRRELIQRKEKLLPELELVKGLRQRMETIAKVGVRRDDLRRRLGRARSDLESIDSLAATRIEELRTIADEADAERSFNLKTADEHARLGADKRARATQLRRHAAELKLNRLQKEYEQAQKEWEVARSMVKVWEAAVPLRGALFFEERAREQRRLLAQREDDHAPLRAELEQVAAHLASTLNWRAGEHRKRAEEARAQERAAREEARESRQQVAEASRTQATAEADANRLAHQLDEVEARHKQLVDSGLMADAERAEAALARWDGTSRGHEAAIARLGGESDRIEVALAALQEAETRAADVASEQHAQWQALEGEYERADRSRRQLEQDPVLRAALELESIDADRLDASAMGTLDLAAKAAERTIVDTRLAMADDERAALHLEEHGLLPPSRDAQSVLDLLSKRLGGQAWTGWSYIAANIPQEQARDMVRQAPLLAQGVLVRPADLERAVELIESAGIEPEAPLLLAGTDDLSQPQPLRGKVLGPKETSWFDRQAARTRLQELHGRLDKHRRRLGDAEANHRELMQAGERLRTFRERYPKGWFEGTEQRLSGLLTAKEQARLHLTDLQEDRKRKTEERKRVEVEIRSREKELRAADEARSRLRAFVQDHFRHSVEWSRSLERARAEAEHADDDRRQWLALAEAADARAEEVAGRTRIEGEEARVLEAELQNVEFVVEDRPPSPGPLDELRDRYRLLKGRYEEKVGADSLLALARRDEDNAREQRARFTKLLGADLTEDVVAKNLAALDQPDTVEQVRAEATVKAGSLQGRVGNLAGRIEPAKQTLEQVEKQCCDLGVVGGPDRAPSNPELAEAEASNLDTEARRHAADSEADQARAEEAKSRLDDVNQRRSRIEGLGRRMNDLRADYLHLLESGIEPSPEELTAPLEESALASSLERQVEQLRAARTDWTRLDDDRAAATSDLRSFASGSGLERIEAPWLQRIQEYDEPGLEAASEHLREQLDLRRSTLEDQIGGIDRHRSVLVDELHAVAEEGLKLLTQASNLSKLPDHIPGIGGANFLQIRTQTPDDPAERRLRLAELMDELVEQQRDLGGVALVQAAVRRLARPIQVKVLHPDPALGRRRVSIPEMARASGGEQLTGAILLYCTLARVRGRSRGLSRRASSVLVLDNPIGRASRVRFLELQREVAGAMGVQLIYTTGVNDQEALRALPNIIRLRNERVDRNSGARLVEPMAENGTPAGQTHVLEAVRIGRREESAPAGAADLAES